MALYLQAGAPEVKLPETSPWPDVKTDDPNYAAYIWVREKGISYGWSDGKFHADAGISNATVAAIHLPCGWFSCGEGRFSLCGC